MMLRSATEAVAPTADLICVVSAVSRETISPDCDRVEEGRRQPRHMGEHVLAQIRHDPLAERDDEVVAAGRGQRENAARTEQHREIVGR